MVNSTSTNKGRTKYVLAQQQSTHRPFDRTTDRPGGRTEQHPEIENERNERKINLTTHFVSIVRYWNTWKHLIWEPSACAWGYGCAVCCQMEQLLTRDGHYAECERQQLLELWIYSHEYWCSCVVRWPFARLKGATVWATKRVEMHNFNVCPTHTYSFRSVFLHYCEMRSLPQHQARHCATPSDLVLKWDLSLPERKVKI